MMLWLTYSGYELAEQMFRDIHFAYLLILCHAFANPHNVTELLHGAHTAGRLLTTEHPHMR